MQGIEWSKEIMQFMKANIVSHGGTWEAEAGAGGSLWVCSQLGLQELVPGQPGPHREALSRGAGEAYTGQWDGSVSKLNRDPHGRSEPTPQSLT